MRALALFSLVALGGCAASASDGSGSMAPPPTGLVLELHFDHFNVMQVALSGSTFTTQRRFGPYLVAEKALPRNATVGLVFDASDAGMAMVCAESHDVSGKILQSGCDTFDVVEAQVIDGSLTLVDPTTH